MSENFWLAVAKTSGLTEDHLQEAVQLGHLQPFLNAWAAGTFGEIDFRVFKIRVAQFRRVADEMQELLDAIDAYELALESPDATFEKLTAIEVEIKKEAADVVITLFNHIAAPLKFNLLVAVINKVRILLTREWEVTGPGVGHHTKKSPYETGEKKL